MSRQDRDVNVRTAPEREPGTTGPVMSETERRARVENPVTWEEMRAFLQREPGVTRRTWRPTTGGLLAIIAGIWNLLLGIGSVLGGTAFVEPLIDFFDFAGLDAVGLGLGIYLIVIGLLAIIGGIYALRRRMFGMALTGSIAAAFPSPIILPFVMGIFSLIFVVLGHLEFRGTSQEAAR